MNLNKEIVGQGDGCISDAMKIKASKVCLDKKLNFEMSNVPCSWAKCWNIIGPTGIKHQWEIFKAIK